MREYTAIKWLDMLFKQKSKGKRFWVLADSHFMPEVIHLKKH